jgi:hypothetical protein
MRREFTGNRESTNMVSHERIKIKKRLYFALTVRWTVLQGSLVQ